MEYSRTCSEESLTQSCNQVWTPLNFSTGRWDKKYFNSDSFSPCLGSRCLYLCPGEAVGRHVETTNLGKIPQHPLGLPVFRGSLTSLHHLQTFYQFLLSFWLCFITIISRILHFHILITLYATQNNLFQPGAVRQAHCSHKLVTTEFLFRNAQVWCGFSSSMPPSLTYLPKSSDHRYLFPRKKSHTQLH